MSFLKDELRMALRVLSEIWDFYTDGYTLFRVVLPDKDKPGVKDLVRPRCGFTLIPASCSLSSHSDEYRRTMSRRMSLPGLVPAKSLHRVAWSD